MSPTETAQKRPYSLRQRYLFVSSIIVFLIFAFALLAQSYVVRNSEQYHQNVSLHQQASQQLRQLRNQVIEIERGLEAFMWSPSEEHRKKVHESIVRAINTLELITLHEWVVSQREMGRRLADFSLDLTSLHHNLDRVMDIRQEKVADFSGQVGSENDIKHAIQKFEGASRQLQEMSHTLSNELETLFQLWRQLQQQFDTFIALKANEFDSEQGLKSQAKMESLHSLLAATLGNLSKRPQVTSNPQRQKVLANMSEALDLWQLDYESIKHEKSSDQSRSEIYYLKHTVEPHFEHLWGYLNSLDTELENFSNNSAITLGKVANLVAKMLWLMSFFGLTVITVAYVYFHKTVLKPIASVAQALKSDAAGENTHTITKVHNLETQHLLHAYEDMHHQVQDRQQALEHMALHDSLTSLPNRYHLMSKLQALCDNSQQENTEFAVMMLGLDRFKEINDTLGQYTGDTILKKYGQRLKFMLRDNDSIARFAGDEFAILLPFAGREEAFYVARKIRTEMEHAIDIDGISLSISCSIGIAHFPENGKEKEELTRRANIAMTIAKQHKTGISIYEQRYDTSSVERLSLAGQLRHAIQSNLLQLNYQPQFYVHSGKLSGLEVLCRWEDEERGMVNPEEFVPVAEHTGQIHTLTEWVVTHALKQAADWRGRGLDCGVLAINISAFNLHAPNFFSMLKAQLKLWQFPAAKLMLEITETAMMADPEHAIKTLGKLRDLGVKLSVDDYGTGFSSLSYVKQLPVHELKIDKSFVMDMTTDENDAIIVRSTIDLAHNLGLKVVAEGVDSQEKQDLLEILNCDYMQGFHLGRPDSAEKIEALLPPMEKSQKIHHLKDFR